MPFITFIYKIGNNGRVFYGKYSCDYISDDHEGLDRQVKHALIPGLNAYRKQKGLQEINKKSVYVGVMSYSSCRYIPTYSTRAEIKCFDFYYIYQKSKDETYVNGRVITI